MRTKRKWRKWQMIPTDIITLAKVATDYEDFKAQFFEKGYDKEFGIKPNFNLYQMARGE